ncbi:uncharacterized protein LOC117223064 [Megalopta genalis]|uniref:uncharacterized protein LOC117223064 n=1 Tax=Megalopta genalis TaxID=115081 RepID=UPI003FD65278
MIITRKVARWALLLKREALGRTYGAEKRSEEAIHRGATAMLPRSGRVDDNIDTDTDHDHDTVATDPRRTSSCVALVLPLLFPYHYYRYYYPRDEFAASLSKPDRLALADDHEDHSPLGIAGIVQQPTDKQETVDRRAAAVPATALLAAAPVLASPSSSSSSSSSSPSSLTKPKQPEEQQDVAHGKQKTENVARGTEVVVAAPESVDSNRLSRQNVLGARFCA